MSLRSSIKKKTPWPLHYAYRKLYYLPKDGPAALGFIFSGTKSPTTFAQRVRLVKKFYYISYVVDCPHTEHEIIAVTKKILNLGDSVPGVIAECGAFHGGSTAKFSLVAKLCNREMAVFDSFEGMPTNNEEHGKSIYGREHHFPKGSHAVQLDEVKHNVTAYGDISRCEFHKGWLSDTLPQFKKPVVVGLMNVDLVQSTKDALHGLYPLMSPHGIIFSQDGHFPWVIELLKDKSFWKDEMRVETPRMDGLGNSKLVAIYPTR